VPHQSVYPTGCLFWVKVRSGRPADGLPLRDQNRTHARRVSTSHKCHKPTSMPTHSSSAATVLCADYSSQSSCALGRKIMDAIRFVLKGKLTARIVTEYRLGLGNRICDCRIRDVRREVKQSRFSRSHWAFAEAFESRLAASSNAVAASRCSSADIMATSASS